MELSYFQKFSRWGFSDLTRTLALSCMGKLFVAGLMECRVNQRFHFLCIFYNWIFHHLRFLFFFWSEKFRVLLLINGYTQVTPMVLGEVVWPGWKLLVMDWPCRISVCVAGLKWVVSYLIWMDNEGKNGGCGKYSRIQLVMSRDIFQLHFVLVI